MLVGFAFTAKGYVPPRYIIFMAAPAVALVGAAVGMLSQRLEPTWQWVVWCLGLVGVALQPGFNGWQVATDQAHETLTNLDRQGFYGPEGGEGIRDAALTLNLEQRHEPPPVILVDNLPLGMVAAYFDRSRVDVRELSETFPADLGNWLMVHQPIYLFSSPDPNIGHGLIAQALGAYPVADTATVQLNRITGVDAATRAVIYRQVFIEPEKLADNYQALVNSLPTDKPLTLLVYPPDQGVALTPLAASHPNLSIIPIGDSWPPDPNALAAELQRATATHENVNMVFVEETKGDPARSMETWLDTHLFRLDEAWFGPVRLLSYAGEGTATQTLSVSAKFGDSIQLDSIDVLDSVPAPGGVVRLRLTWRALAVNTEQYKVFTHIFSGDKILAQHDGQPVGELRPTTTWQTGETITDQFAIRLPSDSPSGTYQIRVGVYNLSTQARLPMSLPDGTTAEFFVGGEIKIP